MKFLTVTILTGLLFILSTESNAQTVDISSGGFPTVVGSSSVTASSNSGSTQNLNVSINLGDISPVNNSNTIKVIVPVAVRSIVPYQVSVMSNGTFSSNLRAFQAADIGFGVQNIRSMGIGATQCTQSQHDFRAPFDNNPENNISYNSKGRAKYVSSISDIGISSVILSGPRLSQDNGTSVNRNTDNGYVFDVIFLVKPQFYAPGAFSLNLTISITEGPAVPC